MTPTPRLAIVSGEPLTEPASHLLTHLLAEAGVRREGVTVACLSEFLPDVLTACAPHCVLLLGDEALRAFHPLGAKVGVGEWRGSLFESHFAADNGKNGGITVGDDSTPWVLKCVATHDPADLFTQPGLYPLVAFDIARAVEQSGSGELVTPRRDIQWQRRMDEIIQWLGDMRHTRLRMGFDLEGYATDGMTDCSFSWRTDGGTKSLWIPLTHATHARWWSPDEESRIMGALKAVLEDPAVPKVCHNGTYEGFLLKWAHGITLRGLVDDSMLLWHEAYPELDKALNVPASILTLQPYWGEAKDAKTDEERALYNCIDSAMCLEIADTLLGNDLTTGEPFLDAGQRAHYAMNLSLLAPCLWQMLRGIKYDTAARDELVARLQGEVYDAQGRLDALAGIGAPMFQQVAGVVAFKRKLPLCVDWPDIVEHAKPLWARKKWRVVKLAQRCQPVVPVAGDDVPVVETTAPVPQTPAAVPEPSTLPTP